MSSAKSRESNIFENVLDLADSTARFGFLFVAEVFEVAADVADSSQRPSEDGQRRYSFKNLEERINRGLTHLTGTLDRLSKHLDLENKKPQSESAA